jgi:hypothetical protein
MWTFLQGVHCAGQAIQKEDQQQVSNFLAFINTQW